MFNYTIKVHGTPDWKIHLAAEFVEQDGDEKGPLGKWATGYDRDRNIAILLTETRDDADRILDALHDGIECGAI